MYSSNTVVGYCKTLGMSHLIINLTKSKVTVITR
jgi:hypothetical protein